MTDDNEKYFVETGMKIILAAGDCRNYIRQGGEEILKRNFEEAEKYLQNAEEDLIKAHREQTKILQQNVSEQVTVLFAHAQDTLMCSQSELWMVKFLLDFAKEFTK